MGILSEMKKRLGGRNVVSEMIGRAVSFQISRTQRYRYVATVDLTKSDYSFYDKLRRGQALGLETSGLLVKPIGSKISSWALGQAPHWELSMSSDASVNEDTMQASEKALNDWWGENQSDILGSYNDAVDLGDFYLVFNGDGTLSRVSPDVVEPIVSDIDYSDIIGWRITQKIPHPTETGKTMDTVDEYFADHRTRTVTFSKNSGGFRSNGGPDDTIEVWANPLGVIPVVHIANNLSSNQVYGTPEVEALVASKEGALYKYDEIIAAAVDGNVLQGRPTPVIKFKDVEAQAAFDTANGTTKTDDEGNTYSEIEFDGDKLLAIVGDFEYKSPGASAGEAKTILELLYWLIVEHTEIPDILMGTEQGQARASGMEQISALVKFINKKRGQISKWAIPLADMALRWLALVEPGVVYFDVIKPVYEDLTSEDGALTLQTIQWAHGAGLIDSKTALMLAPIVIDDIEGVVEAAKMEADARPDREEVDFDGALENAIAENDRQAEEA